jgi:hypothetical protein
MRCKDRRRFVHVRVQQNNNNYNSRACCIYLFWASARSKHNCAPAASTCFGRARARRTARHRRCMRRRAHSHRHRQLQQPVKTGAVQLLLAMPGAAAASHTNTPTHSRAQCPPAPTRSEQRTRSHRQSLLRVHRSHTRSPPEDCKGMLRVQHTGCAAHRLADALPETWNARRDSKSGARARARVSAGHCAPPKTAADRWALIAASEHTHALAGKVHTQLYRCTRAKLYTNTHYSTHSDTDTQQLGSAWCLATLCCSVA